MFMQGYGWDKCAIRAHDGFKALRKPYIYIFEGI